MDLTYRLLNVFGIEGDPFSGNPLCVFDRVHAEAPDLPAAEMQAWARQLNLSESTFVTGVDPGSRQADVRIFTAGYEMPFAGHPTLGTAHALAGQWAGEGAPCDEVTLSVPAGAIPVSRTPDGWQLRVKPPRLRDVGFTPIELAAAMGVDPDSIVAGGSEGGPEWVDTGVEQLVVWLTDVEAVRSCVPDVGLMHEYLRAAGSTPHVYVWAWVGDDPSSGAPSASGKVEARLFAVSGSTLDEDPATGSACANLGGWLVARGMRDLAVTVSQGAAVGRPSRLHLSVDADGGINVAGRVTEVGSGIVHRGRA